MLFLRFRTAINVVGDSIGAGIVYHLSKDELNEEEKQKQQLKNGFESVPMSDIDEIVSDTKTEKWEKEVRILVNPHALHRWVTKLTSIGIFFTIVLTIKIPSTEGIFIILMHINIRKNSGKKDLENFAFNNFIT